MELDSTKLSGNMALDGGRGAVVDIGRKGDWMQTWTGKRFYPADPRPQDVDPLDLVFALSNCTRYGGHCRFYSVMEHSVLVSYLVPPEHARHGFAHDFAECYLSDIVRPVKRILGKDNDWFKIEDMLWTRAICPMLGLDPVLPQSVIEMDTAICVLEKRRLHPRSDAWHLPYPEPRATINGWTPQYARERGLARLCELFPQFDRDALAERMSALVEQDHKAFAAA